MKQAKSLYRSRAVSHFYGTEYEILAGFGPVGNTEKKNWVDYEQLLRGGFFMFTWQKKIFRFFKKYCSVCTKKLQNISLFWHKRD